MRIQHRNGLLSRSAICALLATAACGLIAPSALATDFAWSGGAQPASHKWSDPANWIADVAPKPFSTIGSLTFPPSRAARTEDDVNGLTIDHLAYESKEPVAISGHGLVLGSGGLTLDTPENGYNPLHISSPISLDDDQTWTSVFSGGEWGSEPVLEVSGSISGEASSLIIDLKNQRGLVIGEFGEGANADDELGDTTINGTESIDPLTGLRDKTRVEIGKADFNGTDGHTLTVNDVALQDDANTGPITAIHSKVAVLGAGSGPVTSVSSGVEPVGMAYLPSAMLDVGSTLNFNVEATAAPAVQYNELNSTGLLSLGGSHLDLSDHSNRNHECPAASTLPITTLVSSAVITGEFHNAPNGSVIAVPCISATERTYQYRIDYNTSISPETITATPVEEPTSGSGTGGGSIGGSSSGGGTSSAPVVITGSTPGRTAAISSARLLALLDGQLVPNGKTSKIGMLLKLGGYSELLEALEAGVVSISWYALPDGAKLAAKTKPRPVLVASGRLVFAAAGSGRLEVVLTAPGTRLLKHSKTLKLTAKGTFMPASGATVSTTKGFILKE
jgi:hypothetical protein